ncbi:hypothetical protein [Azospirillum ramasamyi]|uniref:Uncharacterized protein n=1 Tax=Azospirillum ramasamyi TaxID=682998 RepID=A0A2U9S9C3_9PROT|nr:hypothetical protein [Azospirillum ramasamyi]AWU95561.1 hypothetical protein DM194_14740 [Azospirillum ramasamyi]
MFEGNGVGNVVGLALDNMATANANAAAARRANELGRRWEEYAHTLETRVRELEDALAVCRAEAEARAAQVFAFAEAHKGSPLLAESGNHYSDGSPKSMARMIFEAAFDKAALGLGITNPTARREN